MTEDNERIVVGVDGSEPSKEALAWAARQATMTGAMLDVVMTWQWPASFGTTISWPYEFNPGLDARKVVDDVVGAVVGEHPGFRLQTRVVESTAAAGLLHAAEGANLLVIGSRGRGAFSGMLLGSVSQHCVSHAPCPVVVVRCTQV